MNLAHPAWLLLFIMVIVIAIGAILVTRLRRKQWAPFLSTRLRPSLLISGSPLHRIFSLVFLLTASTALIIALSRPQGDAGTRVEKASGRNVMVALDLSRSMRTADVKPDRLAQGKIVIEELIEAMPDERFGLIGFAGKAYVYAPLTVDHAAVRETVSQIDETWAPSGGTHIHNAVRLAIDTLKQTGQRNNALVLISDGEKHDGALDSMIAEAKRSGVYILTVGVGTPDGDYVPDKNSANRRAVDRSGRPVISRLQPDVLRQLATGTNGRFAIAGTGLDIPEMVRSVIKDLDAFEAKGTQRKIVVEFYQWLVLPGILFLMASIIAGTRWRRAKSAIVPIGVLAALMPMKTKADGVGDARAQLHDGKWREAATDFHRLAEKSPFAPRKAAFRAGEAEALLKAKQWNEAIAAWSEALRSNDSQLRAAAHAGVATALFQKGWVALSAQPYKKPPANDFSAFDQLVRDYLSKIVTALFAPPTAEGPSVRGLRDVVTDWSDAVRHWQTAAALGGDPAAKSNAALARAYLTRLQELLKENQEQQQQNGNSQGGSGESEEQDSEGEGEGNQNHPNEGPGSKKPDDKGNGNDKKDDRKPGETPEEQARRKLKENSDLEHGPLTPGRPELRDPDKDW